MDAMFDFDDFSPRPPHPDPDPYQHHDFADYLDMGPKSPVYDHHAFSAPLDADASWTSWLNEPVEPSPGIPIPTAPPQTGLGFVPNTPESCSYHTDASFSPSSFSPMSDFAALHPSPSGASPLFAHPSVYSPPFSVSPPDTTAPFPAWASQLWDSPSPPLMASPLSPPMALPSLPAEDDNSATQRLPIPRRRTTSITQLFQSSSAPSAIFTRPHMLSRPYSRRAESVSMNEDHDATVRRKRRSQPAEDPGMSESGNESSTAPQKSMLRPPKLAPSAWQLYFTDWIQRHQATSTKKLNVAQAAKEAGQEYANLTPAEKEPYKRRSQALKEQRERENAAYMRTLTPDDIKRENVFRASQRKAGKSRKGNIKDPNAPKKPLSAYFMFLQAIRSDPGLVQEVFGSETETTKQSILAAQKWRSMTDDERKPFLAQAEREKLEYETARRIYEDGSTGSSPGFSSINFSVLPGNPLSSASIPRLFAAAPSMKVESDVEGEYSLDGTTPVRS